MVSKQDSAPFTSCDEETSKTKEAAPKSTNKKFLINTTNARHELALLQAILESEKSYQEVHIKDGKANLIWQFPLHQQDNNERIMDTKAIFNRMPGIGFATNKRKTAQVFKRMSRQFESEFNFTPTTFVLPAEIKQLQGRMAKHPNRPYIIKPSGGAEGCGIFLVMRFKDIPAYVLQQDYVAQEYLADPLLIDGKKFDLRIYVLVTNLGSSPGQPCTAFIADEGLVRLCTKDYEKPEQKNLHNLLQHLTNYSLNKLSEDYVKSDDLDNLEGDQASKRTLSSVFDSLKKEGVDTDYLFEQISEVCQKSLVALQPHSLREQAFQFNGQFPKAKGDCFQVLGFDVFIDSKLKPWVLEINDHPSLNINLCLEGQTGLIKELSEVDKFIKVKVIGDAIKLMQNHKSIAARSEIETYRCWHRLLPDQEMDDLDSYIKAKDIYEALTTKLWVPMTLSAFTKLVKIQPFGQHLQKVQLEIMYKRLTKLHDTNQMDLDIFFDALEELAMTLYPFEPASFDAIVELLVENIDSLKAPAKGTTQVQQFNLSQPRKSAGSTTISGEKKKKLTSKLKSKSSQEVTDIRLAEESKQI